MGEYYNDFDEYHNDFQPDWEQQEVRVPLDEFVSMREDVVRLVAERDMYSQKWSQTLIECEKAKKEAEEYRAIIDRFLEGSE